MHRRCLLIPFLALFAIGCGKSPPADVPSPAPDPTKPTLPTEVVAAFEMDPAKQIIPAKPIAGMLGGQPFALSKAEISKQSLQIRQGTGFFADREVMMFFSEYNPNAPFKLAVSPNHKRHEAKITSLHVSSRKGEELPKVDFVNDGYAMTLELEPRKNGKVAGKIALSLPGADQSYLAGTFVAEYQRELDDAPEPEDRPFVKGSITHKGQAKQMLRIQYAGMPDGATEPISDMTGSGLTDKGQSLGVRSTSHAPRLIGLRPTKTGLEFDATRLPPGKYFFLARLDDGPAAWALADVRPDSQLELPLTIPVTGTGQLDVSVVATITGQVQAIPVGLKLDDPTGTFTTAISGALGSYANINGGSATIKNLTPGKYDISLRTGRDILKAEATIEAGKTAKVDWK